MPISRRGLLLAIGWGLPTLSIRAKDNGRWTVAGLTLGVSWKQLAPTLSGKLVKLRPEGGAESYFVENRALTVMVINDEVSVLTGPIFQDGTRVVQSGQSASHLKFLGNPRDSDQSYLVFTQPGVRLLVRVQKSRIVEFTLEKG